jgi:hypothetical protein
MFYVVIIGTCQYGYAWADKAYSVDLAHQYSECSGAGICDQGSGVCDCFDGFKGQACERGKKQSDRFTVCYHFPPILID